MNNPFVSIIITTRNEEAHIQSCLLSITNQTYKNIEIIVVDNASEDRTKDIARRFTRSVFDKGPERSAQRNFGAKHAKGEYLLFLDADMILSPTNVSECVKVCLKHKAIILPEDSFGQGFWSRCKVLERSFYKNVVWMEAARFFSAKSFQILHGFDEQLTGPEDFDLTQRLRMHFGKNSVGRTKSVIRHDEGYIKLSDLLQKKYYYGEKMKTYRKKASTQTYFSKQANVFSRYRLFFKNPKKLFSDPMVGMGMLFMKMMEMIALGIGAML